jgi:hypothetical protein
MLSLYYGGDVMRIEKKIWPDSFNRVASGEEKFEVRLGDFDCKAGDILVLKEWNPTTMSYTGRTIEKKVKNVEKTKVGRFYKQEDIEKHGLQVIEI